jgi:hypothetical protein
MFLTLTNYYKDWKWLAVIKKLNKAMLIIALLFLCLIDANSGGEGGRGRVNIGPPQVNFKTLVNKNEIEAKIGEPPSNFSWKPWPP